MKNLLLILTVSLFLTSCSSNNDKCSTNCSDSTMSCDTTICVDSTCVDTTSLK